jgi:hypothetical protein
VLAVVGCYALSNLKNSEQLCLRSSC